MSEVPLEQNNSALDELDRRLLARLMHDGRATWADLAEALGLTAPAIAQRVHRLVDRGVIRHFAAIVAPETVAPVTAYVTLTVERPDPREKLTQRLATLDSVQECVRLAGEADYLLKVRTSSLADLDELVTGVLGRIAGVVHTRASVVLAAVKDTPVLPIPGLKPKPRGT